MTKHPPLVVGRCADRSCECWADDRPAAKVGPLTFVVHRYARVGGIVTFNSLRLRIIEILKRRRYHGLSSTRVRVVQELSLIHI